MNFIEKGIAEDHVNDAILQAVYSGGGHAVYYIEDSVAWANCILQIQRNELIHTVLNPLKLTRLSSNCTVVQGVLCNIVPFTVLFKTTDYKG